MKKKVFWDKVKGKADELYQFAVAYWKDTKVVGRGLMGIVEKHGSGSGHGNVSEVLIERALEEMHILIHTTGTSLLEPAIELESD